MQQLKQQLLNKRTILSFLVSFAIIFYIFSKINVFQLINTLKKVSMSYFMFAFLCFYLSIFLKSIRWRILLKNASINLDLKSSFIIFYLSMFINSIIPAKMGDVYRGYLLKKKTNSSMSLGFGTVFIERIFDLITMISLLIICGYLSFRNCLPDEIIISLKYGTILVVFLILATYVFLLINKKLTNCIKNHNINNMLINFEKGLKVINTKTLPILVFLSLISWIIEGFTIYFIFISLGIDLSIIFSIFADLSSSLLTAVPLTPSGLGVVEYALIYILKLKHILEVKGLAVVILYRAITYLSIILLGGLLHAMWESNK